MENHRDGTCSSTLVAEPLWAHLPSAFLVSCQFWVSGSSRGRRSPCCTSPGWPGVLQFIPGVEALGKINHQPSSSCCSCPCPGPPDHPEGLGCQRLRSKLSSLRSDLKARKQISRQVCR